MKKSVPIAPLFFTQLAIKKIAKKKVPGTLEISIILQHTPYWVFCYQFLISRIFMKPRPMDIWIACDGRNGNSFPIRIDSEVFIEETIELDSELLECPVDEETAKERTRKTAYEAFIKRYLSMKEPEVNVTFNKVVYFPIWKVEMHKKDGSKVQLLINGRSGMVEMKTNIQ
jgi:hypothetical protein